jgi:hypothetical protein
LQRAEARQVVAAQAVVVAVVPQVQIQAQQHEEGEKDNERFH